MIVTLIVTKGEDSGKIFKPRLRFRTLEELNAWLEDQCQRFARDHRHPEFRDRSVAEVFEAERAALVPVTAPFEGFREVEAVVSSEQAPSKSARETKEVLGRWSLRMKFTIRQG